MWGNGPISGTANTGKDMSTTTATKLECTACHDPHGNGQYRILRAVPSDSGFTAILPGNTTPGIVIKDTANKVYTTTNYWIAGDPNAVADTGTTTILGGTSSVGPDPDPEDDHQPRQLVPGERRRVVHDVPHAVPRSVWLVGHQLR